jgi:hypothetical protein
MFFNPNSQTKEGDFMMRTMTLEETIRKVPSIGTETPLDGLSGKYVQITTKKVLEKFLSEGWLIREAKETKGRRAEVRPYRQHLVRLFHPDYVPQETRGELIPEILLRNSHDGKHAWEMMSGIFRLVCSNGLVVPESLIASVKIRHSGKEIYDLLNASFSFAKDTQKIFPQIERMKVLDLDEYERTSFARKAIEIRFGSEEENAVRNRPTPESILQPRRREDQGKDLWRTMNTVQEYLSTGGSYNTGPFVHRRIKGIRSISEDIRINRGIWDLGQSVLSSKTQIVLN